MARLHRDMPPGRRVCGTGRLGAADGAREGDGRARPGLGTFPPPAAPFVQPSSGYWGEQSPGVSPSIRLGCLVEGITLDVGKVK